MVCSWCALGKNMDRGVPQTSQAGALQFSEETLRLCALHPSLRPSCQHCWPYVQAGYSPADC